MTRNTQGNKEYEASLRRIMGYNQGETCKGFSATIVKAIIASESKMADATKHT